ncbi:RDD family protein [Coraliomargarita akajimensis]|uniref:RDD domain containing protein n=1 Tax=Coraliomargarita akajimensis (strain DSM 45221 / IAM 15411 / JCM 23193 / KCTC 12865 / 04OKA010-24) TaxID=583355 RepID=D5EIH7_CORAD|nr:RDD family protein [Coraliomargarita akajimensis]ADE54243.1 RDD domain containing protein [Coraliomargarita akajimensis DSM 45221]
MNERTNQLIIQTPEGVEFVHQLASPVARFIALAIDVSATWAILSILSITVTLMGWISRDMAMAFYILLYFVVCIGYYILLEMLWRGQTLGKRVMRLRVIDSSGLKLRPNQLILRNLMRFVDSLPILYFLGGACALLSRKSQRLGDYAAGTVVIRQRELHPPKLSELSSELYNSFRDHPRLEAQLRQKVSPEHSELVLQALRRRDEMDPIERTKLYKRLAASFRQQVVFPEQVTESISDEQYLRNCVDTIYRGVKS